MIAPLSRRVRGKRRSRCGVIVGAYQPPPGHAQSLALRRDSCRPCRSDRRGQRSGCVVVGWSGMRIVSGVRVSADIRCRTDFVSAVVLQAPGSLSRELRRPEPLRPIRLPRAKAWLAVPPVARANGTPLVLSEQHHARESSAFGFRPRTDGCAQFRMRSIRQLREVRGAIEPRLLRPRECRLEKIFIPVAGVLAEELEKSNCMRVDDEFSTTTISAWSWLASAL